jgi:predicted O-methyltransferase YrrM
MNEIIINTDTNKTTSNYCGDPYDHLETIEWVDIQINYGSDEKTISGRGLLTELQKLQGELQCCEIGICHGFTTEYLLKNVPNIKKYIATDPYPTFVDWNGTRLTRERQDEIKKRCLERLKPYSDKIEFHFEDSTTVSTKIENESLDFVFIDGDHSYVAALSDIQNYWHKVKFGGIFAGHDINLPSIQRAIKEYFGNDVHKIKIVENNAWYFIK